MLYADDTVLCSTRRDEVENKLEEWRRAISRQGGGWRSVERNPYTLGPIEIGTWMGTRVSIYSERIWKM